MPERNLIGIAQTVSGETLVFILAMFRHILNQPKLEEIDGPKEMDVLDVVGVLDRKEEERTSIPRVFRDRSVPFEALSDTEFRKDYRFTKPTFFKICGLLAEDLSHKTGRGSDLPVALQVCICIHLLGRNVMQSDSARIAGCNQTTVSREAKRWRYNGRSSKYRIPGIVGIIDGTHVHITAPVESEEDYVNRKNFHSLNVGVVVDYEGRIRWVSTKWPGSTHDSRVLKSSELYHNLTRGTLDGVIIGDSAYAAETFLLKPITNPSTPKEERYNRSLCSARSRIERCFGVLKRQFHILHAECRYAPAKAAQIVLACCILRNIAIDSKELDDYDGSPMPVCPSCLSSPSTMEHYIRTLPAAELS
ncbi:unnamed protein product [Heligmosomoides polygyrus]|uniref:DDE Tnp4 domain-containing protein n=1 Tax=Heligmosomoides polygyrus TaxID=6339 RepID=A0A183FWW1_HELPZ|nr:unnamed protein product [Heligmosomoides polygyrus]